jgi:hypothetical protein
VFLLRRGELFFSSAAGKKNLGFSGLASRLQKKPESYRTGQPAKKKNEEKNTRAGPVLAGCDFLKLPQKKSVGR